MFEPPEGNMWYSELRVRERRCGQSADEMKPLMADAELKTKKTMVSPNVADENHGLCRTLYVIEMWHSNACIFFVTMNHFGRKRPREI
jgi:hypothetical protein